MSRQEVDRLEILQRLRAAQITIAAAARILGLSERQCRRLLRRYEAEGPTGLISRRRGRPSNRRLPAELVASALELVREHYADFGPTFANEKLRDVHGLVLSTESLRTAMIAAELWTKSKKRRRRLHPLRERRPAYGELLQIDGSPHDWFEGRGPRCSLLVFIDDATSKLMELRFVNAETTLDYFAALDRYLTRFGRPRAIYSDRHSIFRSTRGDAVTQMERALGELGIELICATTPQAKGRVERANRTLQQRLVRELRLRSIASMTEANAYVDQFREDFNRRFAREPARVEDAHEPCAGFNLNYILAVRSNRRLSKDGTLRSGQSVFVAERDDLRGREHIELVEHPNREFHLRLSGEPLPYRRLRDAQSQAQLVSSKELNPLLDRHGPQGPNPRKGHRPPYNHPWRRIALSPPR